MRNAAAGELNIKKVSSELCHFLLVEWTAHSILSPLHVHTPNSFLF